MSVDEFRRHKFLPAQWRKELQTNGILQAVLSVMEDSHPDRFALHGDSNQDVSPTRAAIELGLTRGYSLYGDRIKLLAVPIQAAQAAPEPTYEPQQH